MKLIMPPLLNKGDTIAIIAPSAGLAALTPHRLDNAIKFLKSQGYKIKEFPLTRKNNGWESAPAKDRAKEIMDAFLDKEVNAIICEIGGSTLIL
jgi:muramoyltetrapeptide carboxypeptidase